MKKIFVNLTCINRTPVYSKHKKLIPIRFGLDRFHSNIKTGPHTTLFH